MTTIDIDTEKVMAFTQQVGGLFAGGATVAMMAVGDRLGLYATLARSGPMTAPALAEATGTSERYVLEWLSQQAAIGILTYEPSDRTFMLPAEHAAVLASDESPASMIGATGFITGLHRRIDELVVAMRNGTGIPWSEQDESIFEGTERFFAVGYRRSLVPEWLPALDGVVDKLRGGARVADVGCGNGAATIIMAREFPRSQFVGFDVHAEALDVARSRAEDAGVSDRVRFVLADAQDFAGGDYDLITFFDSLHDLGDPVGAVGHARSGLADGGTVMVIEPFAGDDLETTIATAPLAPMSFAVSAFLCTANSISQPGSAALGSQAGPAREMAVLTDGGFTNVRNAHSDGFHYVLEARR